MAESEIILEVKNLNKSYEGYAAGIFDKKNPNTVLKDVSFFIKRGEIFGLVGESGCGKSTLGRSIIGLVEDWKGEILLDGENIKKACSISSRLQIVFQDPLSSLNPRRKIGWILEEPLKIHRRGTRKERRKRVDEMLELIGLDSSYRDRYPHELSGGQRQRISIGSALMLEPEMIIADEPVSALDVSVQSQILNLLQDLHDRLNLTLLFISHDLNVVYYLCDRVAVMYLGRIVELADVDELYNHPLHPYTRALFDAIPGVEEADGKENHVLEGEADVIDAAGSGCGFCSRCPGAQGICSRKVPEMTCFMTEKGTVHWVRCHYPEAGEKVNHLPDSL